MGTEIDDWNFADTDRNNQLALVAIKLGLEIRSKRSLLFDRAAVELNAEAFHSCEGAGESVLGGLTDLGTAHAHHLLQL